MTQGRAQRTRRTVVGLIVVIALAILVPIAAGTFAVLLMNAIGMSYTRHELATLYIQHGVQLAIALAVIAVMRRFVRADYGLHMPEGPTYVASALAWGAALGLIMLAIDYAPQLLSGTKPTLGYPLDIRNGGSWLFFQAVYVGPTEEIPFRSMLVPFLTAMWPARVRLGRYEMAWAGVFVAALFALLHASSFADRPWPLALGQQAYAFMLGVLYAYWLEKSRSVVAPIVGHNVSDGVEYALLFGWVALG